MEENQQSPKQPNLCRGNCGFFGSPVTGNYCSTCYKKEQLLRCRTSNCSYYGSSDTEHYCSKCFEGIKKRKIAQVPLHQSPSSSNNGQQINPQQKMNNNLIMAQHGSLGSKDGQASTSKKFEITKYEIAEGATGYNYKRIFKKCMNRNVEEVTITDPYVSNPNQVHNFVSFCETLVVGCENLKSIRLITRPANDLREKDGLKNLELLRQSLFEHSVKLEIELQLGVHLRNIDFNNGFVVKIDRGLDLFDSSGGFALGSKNFKLRHCKQTYVEIQKEC